MWARHGCGAEGGAHRPLLGPWSPSAPRRPGGTSGGGGGWGRLWCPAGRGPQQAWRCPEPLTAKGKRQEVRVHKTSGACRLLGPRSPPRLSPPPLEAITGGSPERVCTAFVGPTRRRALAGLPGPARCRPSRPLLPLALRARGRDRRPYRAGPVSFPAASPAGRLCCSWPRGLRDPLVLLIQPGSGAEALPASSPRPAAASGPRAWSGAGPPSAFSPHRRPPGVRSRPARSACRSLARASLPPFITDAMLSVFCTPRISAVSDAPGCVGNVPDGQVVPRKFCDAIYLCFPMSRVGHTGSDSPSPNTRSAVGGRRHLAAPCARMRLGVRTVEVGGWPPPAPLRRQRPRRPRRLFSRAWAFGGSRGDGAPLCCGKRGFLVSGCFLGDCPPQ